MPPPEAPGRPRLSRAIDFPRLHPDPDLIRAETYRDAATAAASISELWDNPTSGQITFQALRFLMRLHAIKAVDAARSRNSIPDWP